ncbi:hypothetical protein KM043_008454 [Ampulex compressa]|nr:hypothetical protein KM043_008454 [Ampulex compressa]
MALRGVMLEVPMMVMVVVGVRSDGDLVVRRAGQMDRRRTVTWIVLAIVIVIDDQVPPGGGTLVGRSCTSRGRFRGCVLHGTHRTYDQHYRAPFFLLSFTEQPVNTSQMSLDGRSMAAPSAPILRISHFPPFLDPSGHTALAWARTCAYDRPAENAEKSSPRTSRRLHVPRAGRVTFSPVGLARQEPGIVLPGSAIKKGRLGG